MKNNTSLSNIRLNCMFAECENRQERLFLGKDERILQIYHGTVSENIMHEMKKFILY